MCQIYTVYKYVCVCVTSLTVYAGWYVMSKKKNIMKMFQLWLFPFDLVYLVLYQIECDFLDWDLAETADFSAWASDQRTAFPAQEIAHMPANQLQQKCANK